MKHKSLFVVLLLVLALLSWPVVVPLRLPHPHRLKRLLPL